MTKDESQYGEAWEAEMMKNPKAVIVSIAAKIGKESSTLQKRVEEYTEIINQAKKIDFDYVADFLNNPGEYTWNPIDAKKLLKLSKMLNGLNK